MIKYKIGDMLKKKGLSARALALKAGISPNTAALLVGAKTQKDYNVCADIMDKICMALDCHLEDILEFKKDVLSK